MAGIARLMFQYGWPDRLIGAQSRDWAFDLVTYASGSDDEVIAGEVKKSHSEIDSMIRNMLEFCADPSIQEPTHSGQKNSYRKVVALRARKAPIFWALGPDGYQHVFRMTYHLDGVVQMLPATEDALRYTANAE